jgi:hypothetical protein
MNITLALFCNDGYADKCITTLNDIRTRGAYNGDIVFFYDEDFEKTNMEYLQIIENKYKCILKKFDKMDFSRQITILDRAEHKKYPSRERIFQYFKFNLFQTFFKQWDRILYLDCGMRVYHPIERILKLDCTNKIMAHHNAYPYYQEWDMLEFFFEIRTEHDIAKELLENYNLKFSDYFISSLLYFDTSIIEDNTFQNLVDLMNKYPIAVTNDQSYLNLYFICIKNQYKRLPPADHDSWLFDFWERFNAKCTDYVMLKYPKTEP